MNFHITYHSGFSRHRTQRFVRRLLTDVLPTLVLLLLMAFAMALVADYAETTHFTPTSTDGLVIEQIRG